MLVLLLLAGTATIQVCIAFSVTKQTGKSAVSLVPRITLDEYLTTVDWRLGSSVTATNLRFLLSLEITETSSLAENELCQILRGIEHLHQRGVIHRDISPQNIGITYPKGEIKLGDFGAAAVFSIQNCDGIDKIDV